MVSGYFSSGVKCMAMQAPREMVRYTPAQISGLN